MKRTLIVAAAVLAAALAAALWPGMTTAQSSAQGTAWEYRVLIFGLSPTGLNLVEEANKAGAEGWELAAATESDRVARLSRLSS